MLTLIDKKIVKLHGEEIEKFGENDMFSGGRNFQLTYKIKAWG
jgi:hypothetical protein